MSSTLAAEARLAALAATQHGVFTRAQAIEAGMGASQIERRVRAGVWHRLFPRVYRNAATPASTAAAHWAALLWAGPGCALSHSSAAAIWRMPVAAAAVPELSVAKSRSPRAAGVTVHRVARIAAIDVVAVHGLAVTTPARTVIDLVPMLGADDLRPALENALARRLLTVREVGTRLDALGRAGRPGIARFRTLLADLGHGPVEPSARMAG